MVERFRRLFVHVMGYVRREGCSEVSVGKRFFKYGRICSESFGGAKTNSKNFFPKMEKQVKL